MGVVIFEIKSVKVGFASHPLFMTKKTETHFDLTLLKHEMAIKMPYAQQHDNPDSYREAIPCLHACLREALWRSKAEVRHSGTQACDHKKLINNT
jgi:hypothetical protein